MSFLVRVTAYLWQHFWVIALGVHLVSVASSVFLCQAYFHYRRWRVSAEFQRSYFGWIAFVVVTVGAIAFAGLPMLIGMALGNLLMAPVVFLITKEMQRQGFRQKPAGPKRP